MGWVQVNTWVWSTVFHSRGEWVSLASADERGWGESRDERGGGGGGNVDTGFLAAL